MIKKQPIFLYKFCFAGLMFFGAVPWVLGQEKDINPLRTPQATHFVQKASSLSPLTGSEKLWNLDELDIHALINEVAKETGKNFVIDPRVQGKVSLVSGMPIHANELYAVFLKVLQSQGYEAVKNGNVIRIVPESGVKSLPVPLVDETSGSKIKNSSYVTASTLR